MKIPLVDLKAQYATIREEVRAAVEAVLEAQYFIGGPEVKAFEAEFAGFVAAKEAVGVASGTAALHLALRACGIGPGDEVITVSHTFAATAEAVVHAEARPVFVDVDPARGLLDPARVEAAITERTRALLPVHLYGHPVDMDPLLEIARRRDLRVIEDAAQAHGATYKDRRCGSLADLACFSFYPGKNLGAYGDAGIVTGDDPDLLEAVRRLRDHGRVGKYEHAEIGWGERLDSLQAAVLRVKLRHLPAWTDARREHAKRYDELLRDTGLGIPAPAEHAQHAHHLYVVRTPERDRILEGLRARGIGAGVHYPIPLHRQAAFAGFGAGPLPVTEAWAGEVLSLPLFPELTEAQIQHVVTSLRELLR